MKDLGEIVQGKDPREERKAIRESVTLQELFERGEKGHANLRHTAKTRVTDLAPVLSTFRTLTAMALLQHPGTVVLVVELVDVVLPAGEAQAAGAGAFSRMSSPSSFRIVLPPNSAQ